MGLLQIVISGKIYFVGHVQFTRKDGYDAQEVDYESDVTTWQDDCDVVIDEKSDTDEANLSRSFQLSK
jgi:hypothetical protein